MNRIRIRWIAALSAVVLAAAGIFWFASSIYAGPGKAEHLQAEGEHKHASGAEGNDGEGHGREGAEISASAARNAGIETEEVGSAEISEKTMLSGKIGLNLNKSAVIKARFPGTIRSITKNQGEQVAKNETLATVESNESLQVYAIKAPLAGTVLARNGSVGDLSGEEPLFTIADITELWAELHVFSQDSAKIKAGQKVIISSSECDDVQETSIMALLPVTESSSQTLIARASVKNLDSHWLPGMTVRADVVVASTKARLAVRTSAVQRVGDDPVIFVQEGGRYEPRVVELGAGNDEWTEVKSGVGAGERYVSKGSFIVKAEIGKSEAEHSH